MTLVMLVDNLSLHMDKGNALLLLIDLPTAFGAVLRCLKGKVGLGRAALRGPF